MFDALKNIESRFFRTEHDTGADKGTMMIWNALRQQLNLPTLQLPKWDADRKAYVDAQGNKV